jgi:hypothetical protein
VRREAGATERTVGFAPAAGFGETAAVFVDVGAAFAGGVPFSVALGAGFAAAFVGRFVGVVFFD